MEGRVDRCRGPQGPSPKQTYLPNLVEGVLFKVRPEVAKEITCEEEVATLQRALMLSALRKGRGSHTFLTPPRQRER